MAEDQPSLHIDTDWKKQAQEEKKRLAEEQQKRAASAAPTGPSPGARAGGGGGRGPAGAERGRGGRREMPPASFPTLVQSVLTQALLYLGDLAVAGNEPMVDLDRARHQIDTLSMLEAKTANNLDEEERRVLDTALYETRTRFISVATQYI